MPSRKEESCAPPALASVDPTNPQSWNRYAYVLNNPLGNVDPSGLYFVCISGELFNRTDFFIDGTYSGSDDFDTGRSCDGGGGGGGSTSAGQGSNNSAGGGGGSSFFSNTKTGCFLKGAAVGAATAVGVGLITAGAVAVGVVSAPVASGALLVAGAVGGAVAIYNGVSQARNGNWAGAAYSAGSIVGGVAGGSAVGATVGDSINPPATRGFWSLSRDVKNFFNPRLGSVGKFLGTGPDVAAATGAAGLAGAGAATAAKGGC